MAHGLADQQWIALKDENFYRKSIRSLPEDGQRL